MKCQVTLYVSGKQFYEVCEARDYAHARQIAKSRNPGATIVGVTAIMGRIAGETSYGTHSEEASYRVNRQHSRTPNSSSAGRSSHGYHSPVDTRGESPLMDYFIDLIIRGIGALLAYTFKAIKKLFSQTGVSESINKKRTDYIDSIVNLDRSSEVCVTQDELNNGCTKEIQLDSSIISVNIPRGISPNNTLRIQGYSYGGENDTGDLYITLRLVDLDENESLDREIEVLITAIELETGCTKEIRVEGSVLQVNIPKGISTQKKLRIRDAGHKGVNKNGDLYITLRLKEE